MSGEQTDARAGHRRVKGAWVAGVAVGLALAVASGAQVPPVPGGSTADPRAGLKPGLTDAGQVAHNMELVSHLPLPPSFTDPGGPGGLNFANSDLAFHGEDLFLGNFNGMNFYTIEDPRRPALLTSVVCPGGQGDVSVYGHLLFMSVEQTRGRIDCGTQGVTAAVSPERFRGVRIFDISNLRSPKQIAAVQTCRGSHTHTLVVDPKDKDNIYVYGSGTSSVRSGEELAGCSALDPQQDPNTALFSIDVIQVPLAAPQNARVVNRPRIFADPTTGEIAGLKPGETHGEPTPAARAPTQSARITNQCHDITVYAAIGLAAGACSGNGLLLDVSDPVHPVRLDAVSDPNFAYWHSATFNNDGTKVIFTDEWGGGTQPRCRATDPLNWGADAIFDIVNGKLQFRGYFKMPAAQTEQENCVAHNGSIIPVPGRDIMVQGWYQGGVSVFDFTDSAHPVEIAYFDRGPIDATKVVIGGFWSAYWFNGRIYGSEIARGLDVFRLVPSEYLSQHEIDAASLANVTELNVQAQSRLTWPPSFVVAQAYLDQLVRDKGIKPERAAALRAALDRADRLKPGPQRTSALNELDTLSAQVDADAAAANPHDASLMQRMAATIRVRAAALR